MAILKCLPGVEVTVVVKGQPLKEYDPPDEDDADLDTVTCYIEAKSGQVFEINTFMEQGATRGAGLEYTAYVDGKHANGIVIDSRDCTNRQHVGTIAGWFAQAGEVRQFKFASLKTVQAGDRKRKRDGEVEELGTVEVAVHHLKRITDFPEDAGDSQKNPNAVRQISENEAKGKALSHSVIYGKVVKDSNWFGCCETEYMSDEPIATFIFKYRSMAALKAEHVIPRTPSPPPFEERNFKQMDEKAFAEMQQQFRAMKEKETQLVKVKREQEEASPRPRKAARKSADSEEIDLTLDED